MASVSFRVFSAPRSGLAYKHFIDVGGELFLSFLSEKILSNAR